MSRPQWIWIVFGVCLAVLLAAMAWVSGIALRLDAAETQARQRAEYEEKIRLALWRMDSAVSPLIANEIARPYFDYSAYYPAQRAYDNMFSPIKPGEVLIPSPLLTFESPYIWLHFQYGPDGTLTSPQIPEEAIELEQGDRTQRPILMPQTDSPAKGTPSPSNLLALLEAQLDWEALMEQEGGAVVPAPTPVQIAVGDGKAQPHWNEQRQKLLNVQEYSKRQQAYQQAAQQQIASNIALNWPPEGVSPAPLKPIWVGNQLLLMRKVTVNGAAYLQGCWLNWPEIRSWLSREIRDLLPQATLVKAAENSTSAEAPHRLASLPVLLIPGSAPVDAAPALSPVRLSLIIAWVCILAAAIAVAVLLRGAVSLSERRGAFVSAVTHELRTPLTTFQMYTEMLAAGMVPGEEKRRQYLETLCAEAERLTHLVENVLAYAQLERGRSRRRLENISLRELLERARDRLEKRANPAGMQWVVEIPKEILASVMRTDPSAIEQILFNLVDNACKYAANAADRRILCTAESSGTQLFLRIRDFGPGISPVEVRKLFRPFSKSAREAAHSAPGVGLGLALSRRLARSLGGDLRFERAKGEGTCFVLSLPAA